MSKMTDDRFVFGDLSCIRHIFEYYRKDYADVFQGYLIPMYKEWLYKIVEEVIRKSQQGVDIIPEVLKRGI